VVRRQALARPANCRQGRPPPPRPHHPRTGVTLPSQVDILGGECSYTKVFERRGITFDVPIETATLSWLNSVSSRALANPTKPPPTPFVPEADRPFLEARPRRGLVSAVPPRLQPQQSSPQQPSPPQQQSPPQQPLPPSGSSRSSGAPTPELRQLPSRPSIRIEVQKFEQGETEDEDDYVLVDASPSPLGGALARWGVPSPALRSIPANADPAMQPEPAQIWAQSGVDGVVRDTAQGELRQGGRVDVE
jgi:hypothetical protein